jgi:hypothetical protein
MRTILCSNFELINADSSVSLAYFGGLCVDSYAHRKRAAVESNDDSDSNLSSAKVSGQEDWTIGLETIDDGSEEIKRKYG